MKIKVLLEKILALAIIVLIPLILTIISTTINSNTVAAEPDHSNPVRQSPSKQAVFQHLTIDDGLSHNSVFHVQQDRQGFIWMTTVEGINRYDGMTMTTFMPQAEGSKSTPHFYYTMLEGRDGTLWFSNYGARLVRYDPVHNTWKYYQHDEHNPNSLANDTLWWLNEAEDGQQAIDKALLWQPDVIVMDLVMPVKSGVDAVREMRQRPELKDKFIVAVSASVSKSDRDKSLEAGFDEFLPKPIKAQNLFDWLAAQLGLTWVYAEVDSEGEAPLVAPPSEQLSELFKLAEEGQIYEIQELASRLEAENEAYIPFAQQLQKLAKGFDMQQILAFISLYMR